MKKAYGKEINSMVVANHLLYTLSSPNKYRRFTQKWSEIGARH